MDIGGVGEAADAGLAGSGGSVDVPRGVLVSSHKGLAGILALGYLVAIRVCNCEFGLDNLLGVDALGLANAALGDIVEELTARTRFDANRAGTGSQIEVFSTSRAALVDVQNLVAGARR